MTKKVNDALAAFRLAVAAYAKHAEVGKNLKELEVVARHTGGDVEAAEAAYKAHQNDWHALYRAQKDAGNNLAVALCLTAEEKYQLKCALA